MAVCRRNGSPGVFRVVIAPDRGLLCITISKAEDGELQTEEEQPGGFAIINSCPFIEKAGIVPIQSEPHSDGGSSTRDGSRRRIAGTTGDSLAGVKCIFFALRNSRTVFAWQDPFVRPSITFQLALWLDEHNVAPEEPLFVDMQVKAVGAGPLQVAVVRIPGFPSVNLMQKQRGREIQFEVVVTSDALPAAVPSPLPSAGLKAVSSSSSRDLPMHLEAVPAVPWPDGDERQSYQISVNLAQLGVSLVSSKLREELLFAELSQINGSVSMEGDHQFLNLRITDVQIDSQLEHSEKPVLLANRGTDVTKLYSPDAAAIADDDPEEKDDARTLDEPIRQKHCLTLMIDRRFVSSNEVTVKDLQLSFDEIEIDIDAETLNGIQGFFNECVERFGWFERTSGLSRQEVQDMTDWALHVNFEPPPVPFMINLEHLWIDKISLIAWCSFLLDKVHFFSDFLKVGLRILMASGRLELKGAPLILVQEEISDPIRGSLATFLGMLSERYNQQLVNSITVLLGHSSLVNIPRMPVEMLRVGAGFTFQAAENVTTGVGSFLSNLTFDPEYINRRQRERALAQGTAGLKEGAASAGKSFKEGLQSLGNVFVKPVQGAQQEGFAGFVKGIGKGAVGTLVKPLDKMGQAMANLSAGIRAEYISRPLGGYKMRNSRRRRPRMLWGEAGELREFSVADAELREALGLKLAKNVMRCITVAKREGAEHLAILIYPKRAIYLDLVKKERPLDTLPSGVLWYELLSRIVEVRASSHGVIVRTATDARAVPCASAAVTRRVYHELQSARRRSESVIQFTEAKLHQFLTSTLLP